MSSVFSGHFDGRVIVLDEPLALPVGTKVQVSVEEPKARNGQFADLLKLSVDLPDSPGDLATQHDHYLYGTPKK